MWMDKICSLKSLNLLFFSKHQCLLDQAGIGPGKETKGLDKNFSFCLGNNFPFIGIFNLNLPIGNLLGNLLDKSTH